MNSFWQDRPTLVTGASGLLGGWLTTSLLDQGADLVCLVRDWAPTSRLIQTGTAQRVKLVQGDVRDQALLERTLGEYEIATVMHLAAQTTVGAANRNPVSTLETNIQGTWTLLEACRRSPNVRQIVVASSDKAYGTQDQLPYREDAPLQGRHPYDLSKSCADLIAQSYAVTYSLPVVITRCGNLFGGGDLNWNRIVPGTVRSVLRSQRPVIRSDGEYVRDYVYVEDAAAAYVTLAQGLAECRDLAGQAFNFSNESPLTVRELVERILTRMDSDLEPDVRNEATHEIREQYLCAEKAHRLLGWRPRWTLDQGLSKTIDWYREALKDGEPGAGQIRAQILALVGEYHAVAFPPPSFVPGESAIQYAGRVFDADELKLVVEAGLDFWLTTGRFAEQFEREFAHFMGVRQALLVNSGSSANLLAVSCLTSPKLGDRRLRPGDEVITVASGFPTTVNPIIQNGLVPVFLDVTIPTYNVDVSQLEAALSPRTRAVMLAHTLGNPFDLAAVTEFVRRHDLWLIEDCCDAVGSTYQGRSVGTFGDLATVSFYPAHHLTMGEGGCVLTDQPRLKTLVESFRDWGRDCWCEPGRDNTCGKRFDWQLGSLPTGYDHKYTYSHIGYNLKATDLQAAVGVAQLAKAPDFIAARRRHFNQLWAGLSDLQEHLILPLATTDSDPSWFGFPIAVRPGAPFTRSQITAHLERRRVATRLLFGGNLLRQPAYRDVPHRAIGELPNSDFVMNQVFWIGVYPGLSSEALTYTLEALHEAVTLSAAQVVRTGRPAGGLIPLPMIEPVGAPGQNQALSALACSSPSPDRPSGGWV